MYVLILLQTLCSIFADDSVGNAGEAKEDYREQNQYRRIHEEILRQNADYLVFIPAEHPVVLSREEYLVEDLKRFIEIQRRESAYQGKAAQRICSRAEEDAHTEGTPELKDLLLVQDNQRNDADKRNDESRDVEVEEHLAINEMTLARFGILENTRLEFFAGNGKIVHKLVKRDDNILPVGSRIFWNVQGIYLPIIERAYVDRQTDRDRDYENCGKKAEKSGQNLVFHTILSSYPFVRALL